MIFTRKLKSIIFISSISIFSWSNNTITNIYIVKLSFTYGEQEEIINKIKGDKIEIAILIYLITGLRKSELNYTSLEKDLNFVTKTLKAINLKQREDEPPIKYIDLSDNAIKHILQNLKTLKSLNENIVYRRFKKITKIYSSWLGHSTTKITEDIYTSIDKNITKEKINKLYNNLYLNFE